MRDPLLIGWLTVQGTVRRLHEDERGLNTAELLGNAALGVLVLVVLWGLINGMGARVISLIEGWITSTPGG